ncbi:MAG: D-alanine--D-alanine ligase [Vampirovibrio sp.]
MTLNFSTTDSPFEGWTNEGEHGLLHIDKTARIAVLCGGKSSERDVSLRSGQNCYQALLRLGYTHVKLIEVDRYLPQLLLDLGVHVAFLTTHGEQGEDGAIQGLLEILGIPYTGNRIQASAITMNKSMTKRILHEAGHPVLKSKTFYWNPEEGTDFRFIEALLQEIGLPMMIKPLETGSSVGMSKVEHAGELVDALNLASEHGGMLMAECFAKGKDLTVGVVQINGIPTVTPILELRPKTGWYDTKAKYTKGLTDFILPAELSPLQSEAIQQEALAVHHSLGCHGVSRTDFVTTETGDFYILEVNSIPGMTDLSDLPAQCQAMGLSYDDLVDHVLHTAVHTPEAIAKIKRPYSTAV